MIIKYEMKDILFINTPCPHMYNPIDKVICSNDNSKKIAKVASISCQCHCKYFVEHNSIEKYIICNKDEQKLSDIRHNSHEKFNDAWKELAK